MAGIRRTCGAKARIAVAAGVALSGVVVPTDIVGAARPLDAPQYESFVHVDTHQWAASQPTSTGRVIVDLEIHDGKVWAGYGDYAANTGPITIASLTPGESDGFEAVFTSDTEAAYNLQSIGDQLIVPATDPRRDADFATGEPWEDRQPFHATHVYDVSEVGGNLIMAGSSDHDAVAWMSADGGVTWTESLRITPTLPGEFMRFYFVGSLNGTGYVQPVSSSTGSTSHSYEYDGSSWTEGPDLLPTKGFGWAPEPFDGGLIYHQHGHGSLSQVLFFDGRRTTVIGLGYDVAVHDDRAFLLAADGSISSSSNGRKWVDVAAAPSGARSLAVDNGNLYVGTTNSELWTAASSAVDQCATAGRKSSRC